jgi:flagellar M-ring protein FliF
MNFLNQFGQQLSDLFKSMTPAARIVTALLAVAIGVSLFFLFKLQSSAGESYLFGGTEFFQNDIGTMSVAFGKAGLNDFEIAGNRIKVPRAKRDLYLKALAENEAVPESVRGMYDIGSKMSAFTPRSQQDQMVKDDKKKMTVHMVQGLPYVERALVEFEDVEAEGPFRRKERSAVVTVKPTGSHTLQPNERRSIFEIVSKSLGISNSSRISLIDGNAGQSFNGPAEGEYDVQNDAYAQAREERTQHFENKIRGALAAYSGARVHAQVEIDPIISKQSNSKSIDSTPVTVQQSTESENSRTVSKKVGGVPGVQSNVAGSNSQATVRNEPVESSEDRTSEQIQSVTGGSITSTTTAGFAVQSVSVSVGIPESYVRKLWHLQNPPVGDAEPVEPDATQLSKFFDTIKTKVEEIILPLIPTRPKGEDTYKNIVVMMDPSVPVEPLPEPGFTDHATTWLFGNWQSLALFFFGAFALVALRGMVKSSAASSSDAELDASLSGHENRDESAEMNEEEARLRLVGKLDEDPKKVKSKDEEENQLLKRFGANGRPVREQLTELVLENPEAAATVLRAWVGEPV